MRSRFITNDSASRLILIYAGWGMDWRPFSSLSAEDYDIMVVWDYHDLTFNWKKVLSYDEVCLIAWSMGVFAASLTIHEIDSRITKRIAVNGTLDPIHDSRGIPQAIYHGTINSLAPNTLRKFYRRMCSDRQQFETFCANLPRRTVSELIEELHAIEDYTIFHTPQISTWDLAIISREDSIFPVENQCTAWRGIAQVSMVSGGHLPNFQAIIDTHLINKARVSRSFKAGADTYVAASSVQQEIARTLYSLFQRVYQSGHDKAEYSIEGDILEIGPGHGTLTALYSPHHGQGSITLWDLVNTRPEVCPDGAIFNACDAEVAIRRTPSRSIACIFSSSTIQWFNSTSSFIKECERVLLPNGYLVLSSFCTNNLEEFTQTTGIGLNLPSQRQWQAMFSPAMTLYVCQASTLTMSFDSPRDVLKHMRDTGVNALAHGPKATVLARKVITDYPLAPDGKYHLTYRPIFIIARRNDINQL